MIKWFPQRIIEYFNKKGIDKVTVDIIKNIWYGKTKLYCNEYFNDFEDQKITYDEYRELISKSE